LENIVKLFIEDVHGQVVSFHSGRDHIAELEWKMITKNKNIVVNGTKNVVEQNVETIITNANILEKLLQLDTIGNVKMLKLENMEQRKDVVDIKKVCDGKGCTTRKVKCQWRGCLKTINVLRNCKTKKLTKNVKCKFCCKKTKKCDCGICRIVSSKCRCTKKWAYLGYNKCSKVLKRKGVYQTQCCKSYKICESGKCRILEKKKCKWNRFEEIIKEKKIMKIKKK